MCDNLNEKKKYKRKYHYLNCNAVLNLGSPLIFTAENSDKPF